MSNQTKINMVVNQSKLSNPYMVGKSFLSKVLEIRHLTDKTYCLRLDRNNLSFQPGQLLNLGLPGIGINREYSIYSSDKELYIDVLIREVDGGVVSVALKKCQPGDQVEVHGPYGEFVLSNPQSKISYVFIATGTGIAPFHCFSKAYPELDYKILHGVRNLNEQYDKQDYPADRYIGCVSQENGGEFRGRVTDYLLQNKINPASIVYLCGNRSMISDSYNLLRDQGVQSNNIFTEVFF